MSRLIERLDKLKIDRRYIIRHTEMNEIYNADSGNPFRLIYYGLKLGYLRGIQKAKRDAKKPCIRANRYKAIKTVHKHPQSNYRSVFICNRAGR